MSCPIFRCQSINTLSDLDNSGKHNKREKEHYDSNPDIKIEESKNNIEIVKCNKKYREKFYEITKEYRKEHEERIKNTRSDRKKSFSRMVDDSKSCVADEMVFTSDSDFFKDMTKDEILKWANTCMEFVYNDLGYTKEQIIHATVHMDEKTPHLHCVVVPLVKKFDKRANKEKYSISKREYIKDKIHLSVLQDKNYERLTKAGFKLERGEKGTGTKHLTTQQLKSITKFYERQAYKSKKKIEKDYYKITGALYKAKKIPLTDTVIIDGEIYHILLQFLHLYNEEIQNQVVYKNVSEELKIYAYDYRDLERRYNNSQNTIGRLEEKNNNLEQNINDLIDFVKQLLEILKDFFGQILLSKDEFNKKKIVNVLKDCYDNNLYNSSDLLEISKDTDLEIEVNNYINKDLFEKDYDIFE